MRVPTWIFFLSLTVLTSALAQTVVKKKVLIFRKDEEDFEAVSQVLIADLDRHFKTSDFTFGNDLSYEEFKKAVDEQHPDLLVLMDNKAVELAQQYNAKNGPKKLPGVGLMGLNLKNMLKGDPDISGIAYESPAYTMITKFRYISKNPVRTVLTLYRGTVFGEEFERARTQLATEGITLKGINVEAGGASIEAVSKYMREQARKAVKDLGPYDAVWVMLDSVLMTPDLFAQFWLPFSQGQKAPFISGIESFVKDMQFCTFAVSPSLPDLGAQASQAVEERSRQGAQARLEVEDLISVNAFVNVKLASSIGWRFDSTRMTDIKPAE